MKLPDAWTEISRGHQVAFVLAICALVAFGGIVVYNEAFQKTVDCKRDPVQQVNIVFDKTKWYDSKTQVHSVDRLIREIADSADDNAEINLLYITENATKPHFKVNVCKPKVSGNPLVSSVGKAKLKYETEVIAKLKDAIDLHYMYPAPAPILESLDTISRERIITAKIERHARVEFHLFSDLVQDSKNASLRDCKRRGPRVAPGTIALEKKVRSFYRDIPVHVYAIYRNPATTPGYPGEECIRHFWESIFASDSPRPNLDEYRFTWSVL